MFLHIAIVVIIRCTVIDIGTVCAIAAIIIIHVVIAVIIFSQCHPQHHTQEAKQTWHPHRLLPLRDDDADGSDDDAGDDGNFGDDVATQQQQRF